MKNGIERITVFASPIDKPTKKPTPIGFCIILGKRREPYGELFVLGFDKIYCSLKSLVMISNYA